MFSPREGWSSALRKMRSRARWAIALTPGRRRLRRMTTAPAAWDARTPEPVSRSFGWDRGEPIDRHYIGAFLAAHADDIRGSVVEVGDDRYTRRFGQAVQHRDVLDLNPDNRRATIVGDLGTGEGVPTATFDCVLLVQTLPFVFELREAVAQVHRSLTDGGVALATVPGISQICRNEGAEWDDLWRFTPESARRLFVACFGEDQVTVDVYGNLASACAMLQGRAAEELTREELDRRDGDYPLVIGVRAVKRW